MRLKKDNEEAGETDKHTKEGCKTYEYNSTSFTYKETEEEEGRNEKNNKSKKKKKTAKQQKTQTMQSSHLVEDKLTHQATTRRPQSPYTLYNTNTQHNKQQIHTHKKKPFTHSGRKKEESKKTLIISHNAKI